MIGMLWYDGDAKRTLAEKVARAANYYQGKYGAPPSVCFVNPSLLENTEDKRVGGVELRPARTVLPDHFWLGQAEEPKP